ncbi:hypothetical protein IWW50_002642 [Coemansia erecta]|nr:hypothetical protein GGF43_001407 [Coemansia sp. RSA 2618]KAJ2825878.1 hypothetical protein IWW50_002642 [Coemansia erecta]
MIEFTTAFPNTNDYPGTFNGLAIAALKAVKLKLDNAEAQLVNTDAKLDDAETQQVNIDSKLTDAELSDAESTDGELTDVESTDANTAIAAVPTKPMAAKAMLADAKVKKMAKKLNQLKLRLSKSNAMAEVQAELHRAAMRDKTSQISKAAASKQRNSAHTRVKLSRFLPALQKPAQTGNAASDAFAMRIRIARSLPGITGSSTCKEA